MVEKVIKAPNGMKKKYDNKMKAKLIQQFYKRKIKEKTGIMLKKIQWQEDDIIHWPDKDKNVFHLPLDQLNEILIKLDQLHLSEEFLGSIKQPEKSTSLVSKITQYFRNLFQYYMINRKNTIPWDKLKHADLGGRIDVT